MISTTYGHFWITFKNGYTVSIFNGFGSYSENHFNYKMFKKYQNKINPLIDKCETKDCEVAIMHNDTFCTRQFIDCDDSVIGYVSADDVADIIKKVKEAK